MSKCREPKLRTTLSEWWFCFVLLCAGHLAIFGAEKLEAASVRFALLTEPSALADTIRFLRDAGCERQALASFESLASNRMARLNLDLSHFPRQKNGFYEFPEMTSLIDALPTTSLCGGTNFDFNCFDAVFLLAGSKLQTALKPDDLTGPFLVWMFSTNLGPSKPWTIPAATPRDAFIAQYEDGRDYGRISTEKFPQDMRETRVCLTAALFTLNFLPRSAFTNTSAAALPVLQASWRRSGITFPTEFEVVLLHILDGAMLRTSHAGLLFRRGNEFTYIEKTCGEGYFIRLDGSERENVFEWLWGVHAGTNTSEKIFVTLNEKITELRSSPLRN
jgi:hypothetical protein